MRAGELDLYIERGCDWERILTIYKKTGSLVNLSLAKAEMQIRDSAQSGSILCTPTIEIFKPETQGKIRIFMDNKQTARLPAYGGNYSKTTSCVYDLFLHYFSRRERILNGFLHISPEVTRI